MNNKLFRHVVIVLFALCFIMFGSIFLLQEGQVEASTNRYLESRDRGLIQTPVTYTNFIYLPTILNNFPPPQYMIVSLDVGVTTLSSDSIIQQVADRYGAAVERQMDGTDSYVLRFPAQTSLDAIQEDMGDDEAVIYAESDEIVELTDTIPNDPYFSQQWALAKIQAPQAWDITRGASSIVVAIVDTGVDLNHPDLANKLTSSSTWYDFGNGDTSPQDTHGHGTHVAGIVAAQSNNGVGVAGIGWETRIMPVKVFPDYSGSATWSAVAQGIRWATDHGANIINLSLGSYSPSQTVQDAIAYANNKGVLVVAAAGNGNTSSPLYPAALAQSVAVASTNNNDQKSGFSNFGEWVDVSAPGSEIYSTCWNDTYCYLSGTSMASPYVAGLGSLVLARNPSLSPLQLRGIIQSTADNIDGLNPGYGGLLGTGRIDAYDAVMGTPPENPSLRDDIAVIRLVNPETVKWYVARSSGNGFGQTEVWKRDFGNAGDTWLSGDFNGDGREDVAVGRLENVTTKKWWVSLSSGTAFGNAQVWSTDFGNAGDRWFTGDANGDGKDDLILARQHDPTQVQWYVTLSNGSRFGQNKSWKSDFGNAGDVLLVGDFNGDGKTDVSAGRQLTPTQVRWYVALSTGSSFGNYQIWDEDFGNAGDSWYIGDFNGDGRTDLAVRRQQSVTQIRWYVEISLGNQFGGGTVWTEDFGNAGDEWFTGDFNGDGADDLSLARNINPTTVRWYVALSTSSSFSQVKIWKADFGNAGDSFVAGNFGRD